MAWQTKRIVAWIVAGVIVGALVRFCYLHSRGVEVCIRNVDLQPLHAGKVTIKGSFATSVHTVGDLAFSECTCLLVESPGGEGTAEATFTTSAGNAIWIPLIGYLEPGYSGSVVANVAADGPRNVTKDIDMF